jgi:hypothetical protein
MPSVVIAQLAAGLKDRRPGVTIVGAKGQTMYASHFDAGLEVLRPGADHRMRYSIVVDESGFKEKNAEWKKWARENKSESIEVKAAKCVEIFQHVHTTARARLADEGRLITVEEGNSVSVGS